MTPDESRRCAEKLLLAFELFEAGVDLKRCQLRRTHRGATEAEIESLLVDWLQQRPGEEAAALPLSVAKMYSESP